MAQMLPAMLAALRAPAAAGRRVRPASTRSSRRLPAGVQLLSLFQRNPALLDRVAAVLGAAPSLADHLARTPSALEGLLSPASDEPIRRGCCARGWPTRGRWRTPSRSSARTVREEDFAISRRRRWRAASTPMRPGCGAPALADAALAALLPRVLDDFAARFGRVRGGGMAVVLLGKAGGREMMAGSDLDLMLIYDHPETATESRGARPLPASQWFVRAAHAYRRRADRAGRRRAALSRWTCGCARPATRGRSRSRWRRSGATTRSRLDLGAHGADPGARGRRAARAARARSRRAIRAAMRVAGRPGAAMRADAAADARRHGRATCRRPGRGT